MDWPSVRSTTCCGERSERSCASAAWPCRPPDPGLTKTSSGVTSCAAGTVGSNTNACGDGCGRCFPDGDRSRLAASWPRVSTRCTTVLRSPSDEDGQVEVAPPSPPPPPFASPASLGGGSAAVPPPPPTGRGVWQRKHSLFEAKTLAAHCGHVQSPRRFGGGARLAPPSPSAGFSGRGALHLKHSALLLKTLAPQPGQVQSPGCRCGGGGRWDMAHTSGRRARLEEAWGSR
mmetsp:Transcript_48852/g.158273  ORF Transcript_48852/g.158273 Transcript_48852/m.158273 type:complete len:231 (-) Transcript_48852:3-695(-)